MLTSTLKRNIFNAKQESRSLKCVTAFSIISKTINLEQERRKMIHAPYASFRRKRSNMFLSALQDLHSLFPMTCGPSRQMLPPFSRLILLSTSRRRRRLLLEDDDAGGRHQRHRLRQRTPPTTLFSLLSLFLLPSRLIFHLTLALSLLQLSLTTRRFNKTKHWLSYDTIPTFIPSKNFWIKKMKEIIYN